MAPRSEEYRSNTAVVTDQQQATGNAAETGRLTDQEAKTLDFVLNGRSATNYLADEERGKRDNPEAWQRVAEVLQHRQADPAAADQLAKDIGSLATSAKAEIEQNRQLSGALEINPALAGPIDYAKERVDYESARIILQYSGLYPPPALDQDGTEMQQTWMNAVNDRVRELATTDQHERIPDFLRQARDYQERYEATGALPGGHLNLEAYRERHQTEQRETLSHFDEGYNPVHTTDFRPDMTAQDAVNYVRERMNHLLDEDSAVRVGPTTFAKAFAEPYLDPDLAKSFRHYDLSDQAYLENRILEPDKKSLLHGPTDDPQVHLEASYNRIMRNSLIRTGMAEAASRQDPAEFAIGAVKTKNLAEAMSEWAGNAASHWSTQQDAARFDPLGYEPAIQWQKPKDEHWKQVAEETSGFTDPYPFLEKAHRMEQMILGPRGEAYDPVETGTPYAKTLTEALRDIGEAQYILGHIALDARLNEQEEIAAEYLAKNMDLTDTEPSPAVLKFIQAYTQASNNAREMREKDLADYAERADELRVELTQAGFTAEDAERLTEGPNGKIAALYDRAIQLLAHADFNLNYIHHSRH